MVFLNLFFLKIDFEKNQQMTKKQMNFPKGGGGGGGGGG